MFGKKKEKQEAQSGIEWTRDEEGIHIIHIRGVMSEDMMSELQSYAAQEIGKMGSIKGLMILDGFQGWSKDGNFDNLDFMLKYDARIEKMAIVGDLNWKDEFLMFLGAGYRQAQVEYFQVEDEAKARDWLK
jgi:hypothetical protein